MRFPHPGRLALSPALLLVLTALPAGRPAAADERGTEAKVSPAAPAAGAFAHGQKAAIDPQTKKLRQPTQEEAAELDKGAKAAAPVEEFRSVQLPSGAVMAEVPESMMDTAVVQVGPDGSLQMSCFQGTAAAEAAVKAGAPRSTAKPPATTVMKAPAPLEEK